MFGKKKVEEPIKKTEYIRKKKYVVTFDVRLIFEDKSTTDIGRSFEFKEQRDAENALITLKDKFLIDTIDKYFFLREPENSSILFVDSWIEERSFYVEAGVA